MHRLVPLLLLQLLRWRAGAALREQGAIALARTEVHLPIADVGLDAVEQCGCQGQSEKFLEKYREATKWVVYSCPHFRLGNAMMQYWNLRADAFLTGRGFKMTVKRSDLVSHLPSEVQAETEPSQLQDHLWDKMKMAGDVCTACPFPCGKPYAPWRIFGQTILNETAELVARVISKSSDRTKRCTDWTARKSWAVVHYRCDGTIWTNEQYGFFRHGFFKERLPNTTTSVLLVGQVHSSDPLCQKIMGNFVTWLRDDRGLDVSFQETTVQDDWLTLATAPILFCTSSTFCLSAGLGNPNTVHYPVSGHSMAVVEDGPAIQEAALVRPPGFHFVRSDYIPGPAAANLTFDELRAYFEADRCDELAHPCVPVGGRVPEEYQIRKNRKR